MDTNEPLKQLSETAKALSAPAVKFIEVVSSAIGKIYEPIYIKNIAKATGEAEIIQAKLASEAELIRWRSEQRLAKLEDRRQRNIDSIVEKAEKQIPQDAIIQDPDPDWLIQFFNLSQDIGNEEVQLLWGKILVGEVIQPNSFSLQTLNVLKLMGQYEAQTLNKLRSYAWGINDAYYIFRLPKLEQILIESDIRVVDIINLESLNLLTRQFDLVMKFPKDESKQLIYGESSIGVISQNENREIRIMAFTKCGCELLNLCDFTHSKTYFEKVADFIKNSGLTINYISNRIEGEKV